MQNLRNTKFYCVFQNETAVTEVSFNDFRHVIRDFKKEMQKGDLVDELFSIPYHTYCLLPVIERYYGYKLKSTAMIMAKAGALKCLEKLLAAGPKGDDKVYQYRFEHYEDLNSNLLDSNIMQLKKLETEQLN